MSVSEALKQCKIGYIDIHPLTGGGWIVELVQLSITHEWAEKQLFEAGYIVSEWVGTRLVVLVVKA